MEFGVWCGPTPNKGPVRRRREMAKKRKKAKKKVAKKAKKKVAKKKK